MVLQELGNLFQEESRDLFSIDTTDIANLKKGRTKFREFVQGLQNHLNTFCEPIKKNKFDFFSQDSGTAEPSRSYITCPDQEPETGVIITQ